MDSAYASYASKSLHAIVANTVVPAQLRGDGLGARAYQDHLTRLTTALATKSEVRTRVPLLLSAARMGLAGEQTFVQVQLPTLTRVYFVVVPKSFHVQPSGDVVLPVIRGFPLTTMMPSDDAIVARVVRFPAAIPAPPASALVSAVTLADCVGSLVVGGRRRAACAEEIEDFRVKTLLGVLRPWLHFLVARRTPAAAMVASSLVDDLRFLAEDVAERVAGIPFRKSSATALHLAGLANALVDVYLAVDGGDEIFSWDNDGRLEARVRAVDVAVERVLAASVVLLRLARVEGRNKQTAAAL